MWFDFVLFEIPKGIREVAKGTLKRKGGREGESDKERKKRELTTAQYPRKKNEGSMNFGQDQVEVSPTILKGTMYKNPLRD
jgi:hypothetical protein